MMYYIGLIRPEALVAGLIFILGCIALGAFAIHHDNKRERRRSKQKIQ
jgi:hypothetical protein